MAMKFAVVLSLLAATLVCASSALQLRCAHATNMSEDVTQLNAASLGFDVIVRRRPLKFLRIFRGGQLWLTRQGAPGITSSIVILQGNAGRLTDYCWVDEPSQLAALSRQIRARRPGFTAAKAFAANVVLYRSSGGALSYQLQLVRGADSSLVLLSHTVSGSGLHTQLVVEYGCGSALYESSQRDAAWPLVTQPSVLYAGGPREDIPCGLSCNACERLVDGVCVNSCGRGASCAIVSGATYCVRCGALRVPGGGGGGGRGGGAGASCCVEKIVMLRQEVAGCRAAQGVTCPAKAAGPPAAASQLLAGGRSSVCDDIQNFVHAGAACRVRTDASGAKTCS